MELVVPFDHGSTVPWARQLDGTLSLVAGPDALELFAGVPVHPEDRSTVAVTVRPGPDAIRPDLAPLEGETTAAC